MMKGRYKTSCSRWRRATTLIEVLAGLVVLGTVLTSVAVARGRFLRQWKEADDRLTAAHAVDELIGAWMSSGGVPTPSAGSFTQLARVSWRTRYVQNRPAEQLGAAVVRVEALSNRQVELRPIVSVDLLVHRTPTTAPARGRSP